MVLFYAPSELSLHPGMSLLEYTLIFPASTLQYLQIQSIIIISKTQNDSIFYTKTTLLRIPHWNEPSSPSIPFLTLQVLLITNRSNIEPSFILVVLASDVE